jgi:hypothetical protein
MATRAIPRPQKRPEKKPAAIALPGKSGQCEVRDADDADVWLNPGSADVNMGEVVAGETLTTVAEEEVEEGEDIDEADDED